MQAETLTEARKENATLRTRIRNIRAQGELLTQRLTGATLAAAGGFAAGALQAKLPTLPGLDVPTDLTIGVAVSMLGLAGMGGKANAEVLAFGQGMLAAGVANASRGLLAA